MPEWISAASSLRLYYTETALTLIQGNRRTWEITTKQSELLSTDSMNLLINKYFLI